MIQKILKPIKLLFRLNVVEKKDGIVDVSDMYTTLSEAKKELERRWNDKELRKKVEDYLGEIPKEFRDDPKSVLFRFIATPNFETRRFLDLSEIAGLKAVYAEYLDDKFCTRNQDKVHLGKICICDASNSSKISAEKVIDFTKCENKPFLDMETKWGEKFVDFHHRLFLGSFENVELFDVSKFRGDGKTSTDVYMKFLALFLANGILFENYITSAGSYEREFIVKVVNPAFRKIEEIFGIRPLIVPLLPLREELGNEWMCYPEETKKLLNIK